MPESNPDHPPEGPPAVSAKNSPDQAQRRGSAPETDWSSRGDGGSAETKGHWICLGPRAEAILRWSFPFGLAAFTLLATIGRRGQYSDDFIVGLRDPATGQAVWPDSLFDLVGHFGRPLHLMLSPILQTLFWNSQWAYHLINAGVHLLIGAGLYRLARGFGLDWRAATGGCVVFLFFPYHYEVIYWSTSLVIAIAAGLFVALLLVARRFARMPAGGWWLVAAMAAIAFAIPCFYEQPAGALVVLPVIFLASNPPSMPIRAMLVRMGLGGSAIAVSVGLYVVLKISTAPAHARGTRDSLTPLAHIPHRIGELARVIWIWTTERTPRTVSASIEQSLEALANPFLLAPFILLLLLGGVWSIVWIVRSRPDRGRGAPDALDSAARLPTATLVALSGLAIAAGSWLPHTAIESSIVVPRSWYVVSLGLALTLAGIIHAGLTLARGKLASVVVRGASWAIVTAMILIGALLQLGWADAMRLRSQADIQQPIALADSIADVPPWTVFMPLDNRHRPTATGEPLFDGALASWTKAPWISIPVVRYAMHRSDIFAGFYNPWDPIGAIAKADDEGWTYPQPLPPHPRTPEGGTRVAWSDTVPFVVETDGTIRLIDRIYVESLLGEDLRVNLPHIRKAATPSARFDTHVLREWGRVPPIPDGFEAIDHWRVQRGSTPRPDAQVETGAIWAQKYDYLRLDENTRSPPSRSVATRLRVSPVPRRAVFRATIPPHLMLALWRTGPQILTFRLEGQSAPLATLQINADRIDREHRWLPVTFTIPPMDEPARLIVELSDTEPGGPPVPIFLTRGIIEIPPQQAPDGG